MTSKIMDKKILPSPFKYKNKRHSVQDMLAIFRYPSADALEIARAEEIFEQTYNINLSISNI
jgi:hypothetical protein